MACVANETTGYTSLEPRQSTDAECSSPELEVCTIRFLLLDGNDFRIAFPPGTTVLQLKQRVLEDQPQGKHFYL